MGEILKSFTAFEEFKWKLAGLPARVQLELTSLYEDTASNSNSNSNLEISLDVADILFNDQNIKALFIILDKKMRSLSLTLNCKKLSDESINYLFCILTVNESLTSLTLDGLTFNPYVAGTLALALQKNQSLESVSFKNLQLSNDLTDPFIWIIASASHIKHISLENNAFAADTVFCSFMSALDPNHKLQKFSYQGNYIGIRDVMAFIKLFLENDRGDSFYFNINDELINSKPVMSVEAIERLEETSASFFGNIGIDEILNFLRNEIDKFPVFFRKHMYRGMIEQVFKKEANTKEEMQMLEEILRFCKDDCYARPFLHEIKNKVRPNKVSINQIISQIYHAVKYDMPIGACNIIEDSNPRAHTNEPVINKIHLNDEEHKRIKAPQITTANWKAFMWLLNHNHAPLKWKMRQTEKRTFWDYDLSNLDLEPYKKNIFLRNPFLTKEMAPSTFTNSEIIMINLAIAATITRSGNCGEQYAMTIIKLCKYISENLTIYDDFNVEVFNYNSYFELLDHALVRFRLNGEGMASDTWSNRFFMLIEENKSFYMDNFFDSKVKREMRERLTRALFHEEMATDPNINVNIKTLTHASKIYETYVQVLNSNRVKEMRGLTNKKYRRGY